MESYTNYIRLYDVLISGPLYILLATYVLREAETLSRNLLGLFVLLTGMMTILFNLHNWLLIDKKTLKKKILPWTDPKEGKYQIHRVFNLLVMYPLLFSANYITPNKPTVLTVIIYLMIVFGFLFNLYWLVRLL